MTLEKIAQREIENGSFKQFALIPERDELLRGLNMEESNELVLKYNSFIDEGKEKIKKSFLW